MDDFETALKELQESLEKFQQDIDKLQALMIARGVITTESLAREAA